MAHASHPEASAPAAPKNIGGHEEGFLKTNRTDDWWMGPALTVAGLGGFGVYAFLTAWQADYYVAGPYMSPFNAPLFFANPAALHGADVAHSWFGAFPGWWPSWLPQSPAFLTVPLPAMFRGTCYYYRKAYYRAFFGHPSACAVGPMQYGRYEGETALLVFQNLHRYTLYLAVGLLALLFWHVGHAFFYQGTPGVGVGSLILLVNACLLAGYTFGCHSWRHLIGGRVDCFSCDPWKHEGWKRSTWFNERHQEFAWASLGWFVLTDAYIRACSMGFITDLNTWSGF
jgi:hypothetical protein